MAALEQAGVTWGPGWRWTHGILVGSGRSLATLAGPTEAPLDAPLHPVLLDNAFAAAAAALPTSERVPYLPIHIGELRWYARGGTGATSEARTEALGDDLRTDLVIRGAGGESLCEIDAFVLRRAPRAAFERLSAPARPRRVAVTWEPVESASGRLAGTFGLVCADDDARAAWSAELERAGVRLAPNHPLAPAEPMSGVLCVFPRSSGTAEDAEHTCAAAIELCRRLVGSASPPRLCWITEGALGDRARPTGAALWGLRGWSPRNTRSSA